jgi:NADH dehydrogenase FAD-containing subunit
MPEDRKNVIILGGGYCGAAVVSHLRDCSKFNVILIDRKPFFECTPSIIQALADPGKWVPKITLPYEKMMGQNGKFIQGSVHNVKGDHVEINGISIPFNYLVLCTGSTYKSSVKSVAMSTAFREKILRSNYQKLLKAKTVLIVGGGLVGVELSSEFKLTYPDKHIIVVDGNDRLMKRSYLSGSKKIEKYLKKIKVEVRLNERVIGYNSRTNVYKTTKGEIQADAVYLATGK